MTEYTGAPDSEEQAERAAIARRRAERQRATFPKWEHAVERERDEEWLAQTLGQEYTKTRGD